MCLYVKCGASAVLFGCDYSSSYVEHSHILIHLIYFLMTSAKSLLTVDPREVQQQCNTTQCLALDLIKTNLNISDRYLTNKVFLMISIQLFTHCIPPYIFLLMYNIIEDIVSANTCCYLQTTKNLTNTGDCMSINIVKCSKFI